MNDEPDSVKLQRAIEGLRKIANRPNRDVHLSQMAETIREQARDTLTELGLAEDWDDKMSDEKIVDDLGLKPFNSVIQVCPVCGKVDVYKDDGHDCGAHLRQLESEENQWK